MSDPTATAAFERQTAIVDSLPHACTMARLENWRIAADEFVRYLNNRGYDVVKVAAVTEPATAAPGWPLTELEHRLDEIGRDLAGKAAYAMVKGQAERQNALLAASSLIDDVINDLQELPDGD